MSEESAYNPAELAAYEAYWDAVSTEKTLIAGHYTQGLAQGRDLKELLKGDLKELPRVLLRDALRSAS